MATLADLIQRRKELLAQLPSTQRAQYALPGIDSDGEDDSLFMDQFAPSPAVAAREDLEFGSDDFMSTAFSNIPHSLANRGRELESVVRDPIGTLGAIGRLGLGGLDVAAESFGAEPTENSKMARQFGREFIDSMSDPRRVAEDPLAPIANAASVVLPFMPKGGALGKVLTAAADPAGSAALGVARPLARGAAQVASGPAKTIGRGVRSSGEMVGGLLSELPGYTTGRGGERVRANVRSGFESPESRSRALDQLGNDFTHKTIGSIATESIDSRIRDLNDSKGRVLNEAGDTPVDISSVKQQILERLRDEYYEIQPNPRAQSGFEFIEPEGIVDQDATRINKFLTRIMSSPDQITARELDAFKVRLGKINTTDPAAQHVLGAIRGPIRKHLGDSVPGYNEVVGDLDEILTFLDDVEADLGAGRMRSRGRDKPNPLRVGQRLQRAFEEGGEDAMNVVTALDERFPSLGLKGRLAAEGMSGTMPTNIVGRQQAAGVVTALGAGGGAAVAGISALPAFLIGLLTLTMFSPKVVGRAAIELGATARQARNVSMAVKEAIQKAERMGIMRQGITLGELLERTGVRAEDDSPTSILGAIGGASR